MKLYVMDAFANRIFGGNQAGVALPDRELSDETMRQIAAEMKHSETAFIHMEPDGSVSLRYFTPAGEVEHHRQGRYCLDGYGAAAADR